MKNQTIQPKNKSNEDGFALVITLIVMVMLTLIGVSATNTAVFELTVAGNERRASQQFLTADSGWKQGGPFLNTRATPPGVVNMTDTGGGRDWANDEYYQIVRNFGEGVDGTLNDDFSTGSEDGTIANIPYWYRLIYQGDDPAVMFGANYRDFQYGIACNADGTAEVATRVKKVFRVGY